MTARKPGHQALLERLRFGGEPVANPASIVVCGSARFTLLTQRLIRLEWSETGEFEDRGTYAFPTRRAPAPSFASQVLGNTLNIDTGMLRLHYECTGRFSAENLSIAFELDSEPRSWVPGTPNTLNLRGTRRTLDRCHGDAALEEGILSRTGWFLFDDSRSVLFDPVDGWVLPRPDFELQDWYFFGHGHDYKGALAEYARFGGSIPLIPRFALGAWWSRYWPYSDQDLRDLVREFEEHDVPLDVLVIDMDWHTPHAWTGYSWNRELFPDPPAFLRWVHEKGLKVSLNLHPAEGVQPFEELYPRFARAMGIDPASGERVPFRITDKRFVTNYFQLLHHPMEDDGVDFWWLDWQQGETSEMKGLDPLTWLNHLHFADSARRGHRPLIYSRWGGLGNHRYQIGFSGDTFVGWPALQFQPYFTATASNVLYGWWGHDIGGHMGGATEPELYARWVQFGALSPILRLHATKDPRAERRPWAYPAGTYAAAKAAFHLRYRLVPYIYSMARAAHDTAVALCRPMYYEYPDEDAAYAARFQYLFGDQMIAAPIVSPADPRTGLATKDAWIPPGTWIEYTTKETFTGPCWVRLVGDLSYTPMLMRAGAVLPLAAPFRDQSQAHLASGTTGSIPEDHLVLSIFPGQHGSFRLYEDDGITNAFEAGQYEWTEITTRMDHADTWTVHIAPVEGRCPFLPDCRGYDIRLEGSRQPSQVMVDGIESTDWHYQAETMRTTIRVPPSSKRQSVCVTAVAQGGISALGEPLNLQIASADARRVLGDAYPAGHEGVALLSAVLRTDAPGRRDAVARLGGPVVHFLEFTAPEEASLHMGRVIVGAPTRYGRSYDIEVIWRLHQVSQTRVHTTSDRGIAESLILDAPFAFDGHVQTQCWSAEVTITWQGATLTYTRESELLFPWIYTWHAVVYKQNETTLALEEVLDDLNRRSGELDWQTFRQTAEGLVSLTQVYGVYFSQEYRKQLEARTPLAAYVVTTVISPEEQEATVEYYSAGPVACFMNGQLLAEVPSNQAAGLPPLLRGPQRTATVLLQKGKNTLAVHSSPPPGEGSQWFFAGAFRTPDGRPMKGLAFE